MKVTTVQSVEPSKPKRWSVPLSHPTWSLVADQCPNCEFPEAAGGYCPNCGWSLPVPGQTRKRARKGQ